MVYYVCTLILATGGCATGVCGHLSLEASRSVCLQSHQCMMHIIEPNASAHETATKQTHIQVRRVTQFKLLLTEKMVVTKLPNCLLANFSGGHNYRKIHYFRIGPCLLLNFWTGPPQIVINKSFRPQRYIKTNNDF